MSKIRQQAEVRTLMPHQKYSNTAAEFGLLIQFNYHFVTIFEQNRTRDQPAGLKIFKTEPAGTTTPSHLFGKWQYFPLLGKTEILLC